MTRAALKLLRDMASDVVDEDYGNELAVGETGRIYFKLRVIRRGTLNQLLRVCAIRDESPNNEGTLYEINNTGRAIARRPELAEEVERALAAGDPFTIKDDRVSRL